MEKETFRKLKQTLCDELDEIARKPEMSAGDFETVHKLTDTIKNIDKICMLEDDSNDYSYASGMDRRNRDTRGRYTRVNRNRGYSRSGAKDRMLDTLDDMLEESGNEKEREAIRRCMEQIEKA